MAFDAEAYRTESRKGWGSVAPAWGGMADKHLEAAMPVVTWMLDAARLQPGHQVLELAAGPGDVGFFAWELIQPGGQLITSDFSPEMLHEAQRRAEERGLQGIRFKQIDAESIDIEAGSLDAVLCRWGFMLMADPDAALRECRRVLKPGGRLAFATWATAAENRWSSVFGEVLVPRGLAEPTVPGAPGQFAWADPVAVAGRLEQAGFVDEIAVEPVDFAFRETFDDWYARSLQISRTGGVIRGLPQEEQKAIRAELQERLARYDDGHGLLVIPARSWGAAATA